MSAAVVAVTAVPYIGQAASFKYRLIAAQVSESSGSLHAFIVYAFRILGRVWPSLMTVLPGFGSVSQVALWMFLRIHRPGIVRLVAGIVSKSRF